MLVYSKQFIIQYARYEHKSNLPSRLVNCPTFHSYAVVVCGLLTVLLDEPYVSAIYTVQGDADKSLARPTSRCWRMELMVLLKRGVCSSCAELQVFFLLRRLKGSMSGAARNFNNIKTRTVIKFLPPPPSPLQGKALKEIHAILSETLGEHAPLYAVRNWAAQFKHGDFSTCDAPRPG